MGALMSLKATLAKCLSNSMVSTAGLKVTLAKCLSYRELKKLSPCQPFCSFCDFLKSNLEGRDCINGPFCIPSDDQMIPRVATYEFVTVTLLVSLS